MVREAGRRAEQRTAAVSEGSEGSGAAEWGMVCVPAASCGGEVAGRPMGWVTELAVRMSNGKSGETEPESGRRPVRRGTRNLQLLEYGEAEMRSLDR